MHQFTNNSARTQSFAAASILAIACEMQGIANASAPINNSVLSPQQLVFNQSTTFNTSNATTDGPALPYCFPGGKDIWYVMHALDYGQIDVSLCGSSFDTTLELYSLGNSSTMPSIDPAAIFATGLMACDDDSCGSGATDPSRILVANVQKDDWILVRVAGYGSTNPASGAGTINAHFSLLAFSTGLADPVFFEQFSSGMCDTPAIIGFASGKSGTSSPQRWSAQAFTIEPGPQLGGYAITEIHAHGYTLSGTVNETFKYIMWKRNRTSKPLDGDQIASGAVPFPTPIIYLGQTQDYVIDLSSNPIELTPGDYWLTVYADNAQGASVSAAFAWLTNAPNGINVLDGAGNPFLWRCQMFPSPGFQQYVVGSPSCMSQYYGLDPDDLYNLAFSLVGVPLCPGDLNGNGAVDGNDLAILLGQWGGPGSADLTGDGIVDGADLAVFLGSFGECG